MPEKPDRLQFVVDKASALNGDDDVKLEQKLTEHYNKTGQEIVVVTVYSLDNKTVEDFANELFNTWGIGNKEKDNGILILLVIDERKVKIETGYGAEETITDEICAWVINNKITPNLKKQDFFRALDGAVDYLTQFSPSEFEKQKNIEKKISVFNDYAFIICYLFLVLVYLVIQYLEHNKIHIINAFVISLMLLIGSAIILSIFSLVFKKIIHLNQLSPFFSTICVTIIGLLLLIFNKYLSKNCTSIEIIKLDSGSGGYSSGSYSSRSSYSDSYSDSSSYSDSYSDSSYGGGSSGGGGASGSW